MRYRIFDFRRSFRLVFPVLAVENLSFRTARFDAISVVIPAAPAYHPQFSCLPKLSAAAYTGSHEIHVTVTER
jgi:hypothetical protein